jgi:hypothetical protein
VAAGSTIGRIVPDKKGKPLHVTVTGELKVNSQIAIPNTTAARKPEKNNILSILPDKKNSILPAAIGNGLLVF